MRVIVGPIYGVVDVRLQYGWQRVLLASYASAEGLWVFGLFPCVLASFYQNTSSGCGGFIIHVSLQIKAVMAQSCDVGISIGSHGLIGVIMLFLSFMYKD